MISIEQPGESKQGNPIQNVVISDQTASARLTLWGTYINSMEMGKSYSLSQARLREYLGDRFLCTTRDGSTKIEHTQDIPDAVTEEPATPVNSSPWKNVKVVSLPDFQSYPACLKCNSKIQFDDPDEPATCTKCGNMQCEENSATCYIAKLTLQNPDGKKNRPSCF